MKKLLISSLITIFISASAFANVYTIKSDYKSDTGYIKIIEQETVVSFKFCDSRDNRCENLGPKKAYTKSSLRSKARREYARMTAVGFLDAGIAVAAAIGGTYAAAAATVSGPAIIYTAITAPTVTEFLILSTKTLNPKSYFDTARAANAGLKGKNTTKKDIRGFRNDIEDMLYRL